MSSFIFLVLISSTWFLLPCSTLNLNSAEYFLPSVTASIMKKKMMNKLPGAVLLLVCLQIPKPDCLCSKPCLPVIKVLLSRAVSVLSAGWLISSLCTRVQAVGARVFLVIQWDHGCTFICKRGAWATESRASQSQELWVRFPFLAITAWPWGVFWNRSSAHATVGHKKAKPSTLVLCRV